MNIDNVLDLQVFDDKKILNVLMTNDNTSDELNELLNTYRKKKYLICKSITGTKNCEDILRKLVMSELKRRLI